jgi:hypothetical protein
MFAEPGGKSVIEDVLTAALKMSCIKGALWNKSKRAVENIHVCIYAGRIRSVAKI